MTNKSKIVQCPHCYQGQAAQIDEFVEGIGTIKIYECTTCGCHHSLVIGKNIPMRPSHIRHSLDSLVGTEFMHGSIDDWKKKKAEFATEQIRRLQTPEARN